MEVLSFINNLQLAREENTFPLFIKKLAQVLARLDFSVIGRQLFVDLVKVFQLVSLSARPPI
jgi:hypothetical protein